MKEEKFPQPLTGRGMGSFGSSEGKFHVWIASLIQLT